MMQHVCFELFIAAFSDDGKLLLGLIPEVSYLSQITIRLFDRTFRENDDPLKYRCEILFSPGACNDPVGDKSAELSPLVVLNKCIKCEDLLACLENGITAALDERQQGDGDCGLDDEKVPTCSPEHSPIRLSRKSASAPSFCASDLTAGVSESAVWEK